MSTVDAAITERVLVLAPTARDAAVTRALLTQAGVACGLCRGVAELARAVQEGAGAILATDEALSADGLNELLEVLARQPSWSELPIVLLMRGGGESPVAADVLRAIGNVTLLDRPAPMRSVLSAVQSAVRGRLRQYQIRDQMETVRRSEAIAQAARIEAEHAGRMKDEFLATLSHELRTPLNAILGWAQVLREMINDPAEVSHAVEIIDRNARLQAQLIEDLLDMSRIISGKIRLDLKPIDPSSVADAAIETIRPAADAKRILVKKVVPSGKRPATVVGDPARLQQVLCNLLSNAVKFTPGGGKVTVTLDDAPGGVEFAVADTGEGLKPEFLPHAFERFRQADASTGRRHGGLGLGLAIVKQLVELHGGTVEAASDGVGKGSTFTVRVPSSSAQQPDHAPVAEPEKSEPTPSAKDPELPSLAGVHVLVVDDDADSRELVERMLRQHFARVTTAGSAQDALRFLSHSRPDVLISDIAMPGMDGYELMRRVQITHDNGDSLPAVALTAFAGDEDRARAFSAGFRTHVSKPIEPAELISVVANLAGRR